MEVEEVQRNKWEKIKLHAKHLRLVTLNHKDNMVWWWNNKHLVPWLKDIKQHCVSEGIALAEVAHRTKEYTELKKALPSCFDKSRIPEYKRMITACDDCYDWEEALGHEERKSEAENKLDTIESEYYLIPRHFDMEDHAEDIDCI